MSSRMIKELNGEIVLNGTVFHYVNNLLHNEEGPSVIPACGEPEYYLFGIPLEVALYQKIIDSDKDGKHSLYHDAVFYSLDGIRFHRDGDLPAIFGEYRKEWFVDGLRHRDGGPAVITPHSQIWYSRGKLHNADGPAVVATSNGETKNYFYLNDVPYSEEGYKSCLAHNSLDFLLPEKEKKHQHKI